MNAQVDPSKFGLSSQTRIIQIGPGHYAIIINRKSRIIMKDGKNIKEKAGLIIKKEPKAVISLMTSAPVCSKTLTYLEKHHIQIMKLSGG